MKPGDHPDFFRFPPPEGRSRESTIVLDRLGRWFHDGEPVTHAGLSTAFGTWVGRHPEDGRPILTNGYDWCYFCPEATLYFVIGIDVENQPETTLTLRISDGSREALDAETLRLDDDGMMRCAVKGGSEEARFSRTAQLSLAPWLVEGDPPGIELNGVRYPIR